MTSERMAAACAMLAVAAACDDGRGTAEQPVATPIAAAACPDVPAAQPPAGEIRADQTMIGQPVKLPAPPPAVQAVLSIHCLAAGGTLAKHKHPWQRYVYLESGSVTVFFDFPVPQAKSFKAGDLLVESTDTWHSVQAGADAPAKLIVIDQVPATVPPTENVIPWTEAEGEAVGE